MFEKIDLPAGSSERAQIYNAVWASLRDDPRLPPHMRDRLPPSRDFTEVSYCWKTIDREKRTVKYSIGLLINPVQGSKFIVERSTDVDFDVCPEALKGFPMAE